MPAQVDWDNQEHTAIRTELSGKWTWEEYHTAIDQAVSLMKSVQHPVDMINMMQPDAVEPGGNPIPHIQRAMRAFPSNHRLTVNVGSTGRGVALQRIFRQMFPWLNRRFFNVATMEEAHKIIAQTSTDTGKPKTINQR
ncbi:MAG TPA: hypothetical protein VHL11_03795 [Phototrophicaceae bacterium]|jgi:hypothetical protein|nr:hypothetical protein [Phototrophicaceae bacterium]